MKKIAVILMNMGGPDSLEAIEPFLYNLFSDHDIIEIPKLIQKPVAKLISKIRAKKTKVYYEYMGGKSPQKEQTEKQAQLLQETLGESFIVKVAMRYWHPFTEEALDSLRDKEIEKFILLPLYPQYSRTTTGSSFNEFYRRLREFRERDFFKESEIVEIKSYHNHPLFVKAWVDRIRESVSSPEDFYFLFSAHSLPEKVIKEGDPYKKQVEETVKLIMEHFPKVSYSLAYQSKVGPVKWLEPMTDDEIKKLAKQGIKNLVVIPVTFVSEHSETLYELDKQYGELAKESGIENYVRVPTLRESAIFIECLKDLVLKAA